MICVYDIETFKSAFVVVFKNIKTEEEHVFVISRYVNQLKDLLSFFKEVKGLIGFNNLNFDYPVIHHIITSKDFTNLKGKKLAENIHKYANKVIKNDWNQVKNPIIPQLDLFTIWNYRNKNRSTSLKWLEFAFRMNKIQDLPYRVDQKLTGMQIEELVKYCIHDVDATFLFYKKSLKQIKLRQYYTVNEGINVTSASEPNIAKEIFLQRLSNRLSLSKRHIKSLKTYRKTVEIKDVIFDYIQFDDPINIETLNWFKKQVKKDEELKRTIKYRNIVREYAEGGLHSFGNPGIYKTNDTHIIVDVDFASFYPHLTFRNNIGPKHIDPKVFNEIYEGFYTERKKYPKTDPRNYTLKIVLNSSYGLSKDVYSFLYDIFWQLQIVVNGQLLLTLLTEKIISAVSECEILFENTDGAAYQILREDYDKLISACKEVEELCNIPLECEVCDMMILRDVNNYINVIDKEKSKIKYKGCFEIDKDYHKNHSQRIVPIALTEYFLNGTPFKETVMNHMNESNTNIIKEIKEGEMVYFENHGIFDFCIGRKKPRGSENRRGVKNFVFVSKGEQQVILDKVIRYYIANTNDKLFKVYDDKESSTEALNKGFNVTLFQEFFDKEDYNINYAYYINECNKILKAVTKKKIQSNSPKQMKLLL